jgi:hypothetical protein
MLPVKIVIIIVTTTTAAATTTTATTTTTIILCSYSVPVYAMQDVSALNKSHLQAL